MKKTNAQPISVVIVDDHSMLTESLANSLGKEDFIEIVGTASDAENAFQVAKDARPQVILADVEINGVPIFATVRRIQNVVEDVKILYFSAHVRVAYIAEALKQQTSGYIEKGESLETLSGAIRSVARGEVFYSKSVWNFLRATSKGVQVADEFITSVTPISVREMEVLRYLARGHSRKEIASFLKIAPKTVDNHIEKIMKKLKISDRVQLALFAIREGIISA